MVNHFYKFFNLPIEYFLFLGNLGERIKNSLFTFQLHNHLLLAQPTGKGNRFPTLPIA